MLGAIDNRFTVFFSTLEAPGVGVMDSHALVWPVQLGLWTPTLRCRSSSWGDGLPRFGVALAIQVMDLHALVWPLKLGLRTPTLWCDPTSWGDGLPRFGVAPQVGDMDTHASV